MRASIRLGSELLDWLLGKEHVHANDTKDGRLYPIDFQRILHAMRTSLAIDAAGIPQYIYPDLGPQYNPTTIAIYGLEHWNCYCKTGDTAAQLTALRMAKWLLEVQNEGKWLLPFDFYQMKAPWISCISQGLAISLLWRIYLLEPDPAYLQVIARALIPFNTPVSDGGLLAHLSTGNIFLEEYPNYIPHVLNGCLYAMVALIDVCKNPTLHTHALPLLESLKKTLADDSASWDLGFWSSYDLGHVNGSVSNVASWKYHDIHIHLLSFIGRELGCAPLQERAEKWRTYRRFSCRMQALGHKILYRLFF